MTSEYKPKLDFSAKKVKSLNYSKRRGEINRINGDNRRLLTKLKYCKPTYKVWDFDRHEKTHKVYKNNIKKVHNRLRATSHASKRAFYYLLNPMNAQESQWGDTGFNSRFERSISPGNEFMPYDDSSKQQSLIVSPGESKPLNITTNNYLAA